MIVESVGLAFQEGSSDKVYFLQLVEESGKYRVDFQYGRRGSTLNTGTKIADVDLATAQKAYNKVKDEKTGKGYQVTMSAGSGGMSGTAYQSGTKSGEPPIITVPTRKFGSVAEPAVLPQLCNPITEAEALVLLKDDRYGLQEKKNGKNFILNKSPSEGSRATNKKGGPCGYPSAFDAGLSNVGQVVINGEGIGDTLFAFDLLELEGEDLRGLGYKARYDKLFWMKLRSGVEVVPLAIGYEEKKKLYDKLLADRKEGVVFKLLDAKFEPGRPNSGGPFLKFKFVSELSARVCNGRTGKNSIGLELLNEKGEWEFRGYCTVSAAQNKIIKIGDIAEIRYLYVDGKEGHLYQPCFKEIRDDVDLADCTTKQIKFKGEES